MNWEIIYVLVVLALAIVSFAMERLTPDQTAAGVFGLLLIGGVLPWANKLPEPDTLLLVLSNPAPLTIAAMFVLSEGLKRCGAIEGIAGVLTQLTGLGYKRFLVVMIVVVAVISAFINNTPVVMVFLPVVLALARALNVPASKLLIPLSYASIFGGVCTLVGTSTNILASGILETNGYDPISMFELAAIGVPIFFAGTIYLVFIGQRLLPRRESLTAMLTEEERKEYIAEAYVQKGSPVAGKTPAEASLTPKKGVRVLEIIRHEVAIRVDPQKTILEEGDRLILSFRPSGFAHARSIEGVDFSADQTLGVETITAHEGSLVEGVIGPMSTIAGKTIKEISFRQRFRLVVVAIHRNGINLREKLEESPLRSGDTLLLMGTDRAIENLRRSDDILLLDRPSTPARNRAKQMPIVIGVVAAAILLATFNIIPIVAGAVIAVAFLFVTQILQPKEGYASVEWSILVLIYSMLALGMAMDATGASALLASGLSILGDLAPSPELQPFFVLAGLFLACSITTELLSNNAAVVLLTPLAFSLAASLGLDPRPFVIAVCIAASASFATPIGYQTNTYVYGVGGYRFLDFARVGLPLNFIYFAVGVFLIPRIWPFTAA